MYNFKFLTLLVALSSLLSSCDIFNGKDESEVNGGEMVWSVQSQEINTVATKPLISDGEVYFLQDGNMKSFALEEGNPIWSTQVIQQGDGDFAHTILKSKDMLFFDQGFEIQAHNKSNGSIMWEAEITESGGEFSGIGNPIMSQDETHLYAGRRGYVVKVRKDNGQEVRRYPLDRLVPEGVTQGATEPIIAPEENILYVPTSYYDRTTPGEEAFGANMFAFEATTGEILWETRAKYAIDDTRTEMPGDSVIVSPPIEDIELTESLIIALQGKAIVAMDRSTGETRWVNNFPGSGFDVGLAVEGDGIYAASVGGFAHKLDLQTGKELWRRDIGFSNTSIPTVQNGRMYFNNSGGGGIWVLDTTDGSVIYHQNTPNYRNDNFDVYISSLGVGEGYMVNVGSKAVYCLTVP